MPHNSFTDFAKVNRPLIDAELKHIFAIERQQAKKQNTYAYDLVKQLSILMARGGKRMRPLLCLLAYQGYGGTIKKDIVSVAAGQEFLHAFFLIHDDIIDRDYHRWGGHNILGVYFERHAKNMMMQEALHLAEAYAILAGNLCAAIANSSLANSKFDAAKIIKGLQIQQQVITTEIGGEIADTAFPYANAIPTETEIIDMYRDKTASYSLALPLQLGALLAGAKPRELKHLHNFASDHGIAYQLQDDILGVFGDEAKTGKPNMSDLRQGKRTVLVVQTLQRATPVAQKQLLHILGAESLNESSLLQAQTIMIECGARAYVEELAHEYTEKSLHHLTKTTMSDVAQKRLVDLLALLTDRSH